MEKSTFEKCANDIMPKNVDKTNNDQKLALYGLYKQATVGDVNTSRPGMFDMKGKAKWDAWEKNKGKSQDQAKDEYVALVKSYFPEDCKGL